MTIPELTHTTEQFQFDYTPQFETYTDCGERCVRCCDIHNAKKYDLEGEELPVTKDDEAMLKDCTTTTEFIQSNYSELAAYLDEEDADERGRY